MSASAAHPAPDPDTECRLPRFHVRVPSQPRRTASGPSSVSVCSRKRVADRAAAPAAVPDFLPPRPYLIEPHRCALAHCHQVSAVWNPEATQWNPHATNTTLSKSMDYETG